MNNNEAMGIRGQVEIILEDKQGIEKQRVVSNNKLTNAFLNYAMFEMMNIGSLPNLFKSSISTNANMNDRKIMNKFGIYVMDKEIDTDPKRFIPAYVDNSRKNINESVLFYGREGVSVEVGQEMVVSNAKCKYNINSTEFQAEFRKELGHGTIKSVSIGRDAFYNETCMGVSYKGDNLYAAGAMSELLTGSTNELHIVESTPDGPWVYRMNNSNGVLFKYNTKTMELVNLSNIFEKAQISSILSSISGGVVCKDMVIRANRATVSGLSITVPISITSGPWKDSTSKVETLGVTLALDLLEGENILAASAIPTPVTVYNPKTNMIDIYILTSTKSNNGPGCHNFKISIDPEDKTSNIVDLGFSEYGYGSYTSLGDSYHIIGTMDPVTEDLYLPVFMHHNSGVKTTLCSSNYTDGIILTKDGSVKDEALYKIAFGETVPLTYLETPNGIRPFQITRKGLGPHIVYVSQIVSAVNLETPITKTEDDVLRVTYKFTFTQGGNETDE